MSRSTRSKQDLRVVDKVAPVDKGAPLSAASQKLCAPTSNVVVPNAIPVVENAVPSASLKIHSNVVPAPVVVTQPRSNNKTVTDAMKLKSGRILATNAQCLLEKETSQILTKVVTTPVELSSSPVDATSQVLPPSQVIVETDAIVDNVDNGIAGGEHAIHVGETSAVQKVCKCVLPEGGRVGPHLCPNEVVTGVEAGPTANAPEVSGTGVGTSKVDALISYLKVVQGNRVPDAAIKRLEEDITGVTDIAVEFDEDLEDDEQQLHSLIGIFPSKFPGRLAVQSIVDSWPKKCDFNYHASGWIVFTFPNLEDLDAVLLAGPFYAYGKPLMLRKMPEVFDFSLDACAIVPCWIQLPHLPFVFWKEKYLQRLCTFVGKPQYTDKATASRLRVSFARVLVEVDVSSPLPQVIPIKLKNGKWLQQKVFYEDLPKYCSKCKALGHNEEGCDTAKKHEPQMFVNKPKKKSEEANKPVDKESEDPTIPKGKGRRKNRGKLPVTAQPPAVTPQKKGPDDPGKVQDVAGASTSNAFEVLLNEADDVDPKETWAEESERVDSGVLKKKDVVFSKPPPASSAFTLADVAVQKKRSHKKKKNNKSAQDAKKNPSSNSLSVSRGTPPLVRQK